MPRCAAVSWTQTPALLPSLLVAAAYVAGLWYVCDDMYKNLKTNPHPFDDSWLLWPVAGTLGYLAVLYVGTKIMANRQEVDVKHHMFTYNIYQVVVNVYMVVEMMREVRKQGYSLWGQPIDYSANGYRLGMLIYVHYTNKYVEMFDTFFMMLRKKNAQMSFLHIYHHALLVWAWFLVVRFGCGGESYFGAWINSIIHVIMYSYYLMASLGVAVPWKRYITQAQMLQFCICFAQAAAERLLHPHLHWSLPTMQMWVMVNMLVLFGQFYSKSYTAKKGAGAKKAA